MHSLITHVTQKFTKPSLPDVATGDIVRVSQKIQEGNKTRTQVFEGIVIARSGGNGIHAAITVRKIASGVGVEKKYLLNSPTIEKITVLRSSKVRRKKIYFLRDLTGKAAKLKERKRALVEAIVSTEVAESAENTEDLAPAPVEEEVVEVATPDAETENVAQESTPEVEPEPAQVETEEKAA